MIIVAIIMEINVNPYSIDSTDNTNNTGVYRLNIYYGCAIL